MIQLKKINKSYQIGKEKVKVLNNINLNVYKGEYIAILGASGSGKSTLMNIIGCMDLADCGDYLLNNQLIGTYDDSELATIRNREIGFIFQNYHLIPQYTVLQNIILPLLVRGMKRKEAQEKAEEMIHLVGLSERMHHKPKELSGGQQQRVAIARALITKPTLLLADEPTGALDSTTGQEILELFQRLNDMGNTIIVITHDNMVANHTRKILRLTDGILCEK